MRVVWKVISGAGIVLVCLGVASIDSRSVLIPVAMIVSGAVMAGTSARGASEWTEE
ncbi:MAG: hypothetical protein NC123_15575 [Butyrivibrio sp.]|nr:hypothetical protein [Acetatifactor muris]MCM1560939.1 hypothetical protein [Butyrivibrio sp.]